MDISSCVCQRPNVLKNCEQVITLNSPFQKKTWFLRDFILLNFIPHSSQVLFGSMFPAVMGSKGVPALENLLAKVARE